MLPLGHIGITTAVLKSFDSYIERKTNFRNDLKINYGVAAIGAMLPDIIDKGLNLLLWGSLDSHGKLIGHTLFFSLLLMLAGYIRLIRNKGITILLLSVTCLFHQFLDMLCFWDFNFLYIFLNPAFYTIKHIVTSIKAYQILSDNFPIISGILRYFLTPPVFLGELFGGIYLLSLLLEENSNNISEYSSFKDR